MKLNNKGFAITTVLYGILILFVFLVSFYLLALSFKKDRIDVIVNDIEIEYLKISLAEHIEDLYNNDSKTLVANNGIYYYYGKNTFLMDDGLGRTYDDYNIRYFGSAPDNYIYFNCSDYNDQSSETCEVWRIIGVFNDKVKIISDKKYGEYAWDEDGENNWNNASLKDELNSGNIYKRFEDEDKLRWISNTTWYLGSNVEGPYDLYPNEVYLNERSGNVYGDNPSTWIGKIGLMYPSDYGYAVDFNRCSVSFNNWDYTNCYSANWLYKGVYEFTITPSSDVDYYAWIIANGWLDSMDADPSAENALDVRPTLYLSENVLFGGGNGTTKTPYQILY